MHHSISHNKYITLKNLRNLRSWFKDASIEDVQDVINQLEKIKLQKEQELSLKIEHNAIKHNNNDSSPPILGKFDTQAIFEALYKSLKYNPKKPRSSKVKYRYHDLQGNICEWTGQGREPITFREVLKSSGKIREEFLVKPEHEKSFNHTNTHIINLEHNLEHKIKAFIHNYMHH